MKQVLTQPKDTHNDLCVILAFNYMRFDYQHDVCVRKISYTVIFLLNIEKIN